MTENRSRKREVVERRGHEGRGVERQGEREVPRKRRKFNRRLLCFYHSRVMRVSVVVRSRA